MRKRIGRIREELKDVASSRVTQRKHRNETGVFRVALAGYTNAGKSSIMNRLTGSNVLAYDKLFATLDSTTRQLTLEDGHMVTLTDTVGFIQKLPHSLVEAFKSTLDEIKEADLILLVADVAAEQRDAQIGSVREVLGEIGASDIPTVVIYNKIDLMQGERSLELAHLRELHPAAVFVSAAEDLGTDELLARLSVEIRKQSCPMDVLIPYGEGRLVELAHKACSITSESYSEQGTHIEMYVPQTLAPRFERYSNKS